MTDPATVARMTLLVVATGALTVIHVRSYLDDAPTGVDVALGYTAFLGLTLLASLRRPPAWAVPAGFAVAAAAYLWGAVLAGGGVELLLVAVVAVAAGVYALAGREVRPFVVAGFALWTPALHLFAGRGLAVEPLLVIAAFGAVAFALAALATGDPDPVDRVRRIGLALLGLAIVSAVFERHIVVASRGLAPDDVTAVAALLLLPALALAPLRPTTRGVLVAAIALGFYFLVSTSLLLGKGYHADAVVAPHRAAELLLAGENPYVAFDMEEALARFGLPAAFATQLEDGSYLSSLNYPAGSFLMVAPFVAAGLDDVRWVYLGEVLALGALVLARTRPLWQPVVAAIVVGSVVLRRQYVLAGIDPTWVLAVVAAWIFFDRRWLSPLALGLGAAARQPAWFFVPFYLLAVWMALGRREALRRGSVVAAAFAVPNFPFFILSPQDYVASVLAPMLAPLLPHGVGLVRILSETPLAALPRALFAVLAVALFVFLLWLLRRRWAEVPAGAMTFPLVPLFVAWRSLQNYFVFQPVLALLGHEEVLPAGPSRAEATRPPT